MISLYIRACLFVKDTQERLDRKSKPFLKTIFRFHFRCPSRIWLPFPILLQVFFLFLFYFFKFENVFLSFWVELRFGLVYLVWVQVPWKIGDWLLTGKCYILFQTFSIQNVSFLLKYYRETALLYDEKKSSVNNKERVCEVIAHELAHQWFGNLVLIFIY